MLAAGPIMTADPRYAVPDKATVMTNMEALAHQFVLMSKWVNMPRARSMSRPRLPRRTGLLYRERRQWTAVRVKIRAPSFVHVSALPKMVTGHMVSDVIACIGTIDIVLGECDR